MYRAHASWGLLPDRQNGAVCQAKHCVGTGLLDHPPTAIDQQAADRLLRVVWVRKRGIRRMADFRHASPVHEQAHHGVLGLN